MEFLKTISQLTEAYGPTAVFLCIAPMCFVAFIFWYVLKNHKKFIDMVIAYNKEREAKLYDLIEIEIRDMKTQCMMAKDARDTQHNNDIMLLERIYEREQAILEEIKSLKIMRS